MAFSTDILIFILWTPLLSSFLNLRIFLPQWTWLISTITFWWLFWLPSKQISSKTMETTWRCSWLGRKESASSNIRMLLAPYNLHYLCFCCLNSSGAGGGCLKHLWGSRCTPGKRKALKTLKTPFFAKWESWFGPWTNYSTCWYRTKSTKQSD